MARRASKTTDDHHVPITRAKGDVTIKETDHEEEYFKKPEHDYVLPPELNMTIRDGFRFGIGFILASVLFYLILIVGAILFIKFGTTIKF